LYFHYLIDEFRQSITCIEDLPNEIFYEIFDYLDGCDIFRAFTSLSSRFQELLDSPSFLFKIELCGLLLEKVYKNSYEQILLHYKHKIISFRWCWSMDNDYIIS